MSVTPIILGTGVSGVKQTATGVEIEVDDFLYTPQAKISDTWMAEMVAFELSTASDVMKDMTEKGVTSHGN